MVVWLEFGLISGTKLVEVPINLVGCLFCWWFRRGVVMVVYLTAWYIYIYIRMKCMADPRIIITMRLL